MKEKREVKTCPLCGEPWRNYATSLLSHLKEEHENDFTALAWHVVYAYTKLLNRPKRGGSK